MNLKHPKIFNRLVIVGAALLVSILSVAILPSWGEAKLQEKKDEETVIPVKKFPSVAIEGRAAIVWDVENNIAIYEKNADEALPLASITKIMTALTAVDIFSPDDIIPITFSALEGGSNAGLIAGDVWVAKDLIAYKLTTSANGASTALKEAAASRNIDFINRMNEKATSLTLLNTLYVNETGLDFGIANGGSYGSARDTARLMTHAIATESELFSATTKPSITTRSVSGQIYKSLNTNEIVGKIPGLIASKTGYTLAAGGNLAVAFDAGLAQPIVIVVLGSTRDGRFTDVLALVNETVNYFSE
jgi:D-alanyl-D-alanine carboxypeptidase (penicillin-binding protein 5/6)